MAGAMLIMSCMQAAVLCAEGASLSTPYFMIFLHFNGIEEGKGR